MNNKLSISVVILFLIITIAAAENRIELGEIIVTSSRLKSDPINYIENAGNVTVITSDDISRWNYKNLQQTLINSIPGIFVRDGFGSSELASFGLRSFNPGQNNVARQLILLDGIRLSDPEANTSYAQMPLIDINNIERIEVYRGGISSLYGFNAGAGVINIITKPIKGQKYFKGNYSFGSYNFSDINFIWNTVNKDILYSISVDKTQSENYRKNITGTKKGYDKWNLNLKVSYDVNNTLLTFNTKYFNGDFAVPGSLTPEEIEQDRFQVSSRDERDYFKNEVNIYALEIKRKIFNGWDMNSNLNFKNEDQESFTEDANQNEKLTNRDINTISFTSQIGNTVNVSGLKNNILTGIEYSNNKIDFKENILAGWGNNTLRNVKNNLTGLFLQDKINLTDDLFLLTGIRYDKTDFDIEVSETGWDTANLSPSFSGINFKSLINYSFLENNSVYIGYSKSYSHPNSFSYLPNLSWGMRNNPDLKSEKQVEFNSGYRYYKEIILFELSYFYIIQEDPIVLNSTFTENVNEGEIIRKGLEIYIKSSLPDSTNIQANFAFNNSQYSKTIGSTGAKAGDYVPETPESIINLIVSKNFSEDFNIQLSLNHTGRQYINSDNNNSSPRLPSYTLLNFSMNNRFSNNLALFFKINNLTGKKYVTWALEDWAAPRISYLVPGAPREFRAGIETSF